MAECNNNEDGTVKTMNDAEENSQNRSNGFNQDGDGAGGDDGEGVKDDECWPPISLSEPGFPCMDRNMYWRKHQIKKNV